MNNKQNYKMISKIFEITFLVAILLGTFTVPVTLISEGQAGTTLSAYIYAEPVYRCIYSWSISKSANTTEIYLSPSDPTVVIEYTVNVEKQGPECYYNLEGYVVVENGGERATQGLSINIDVYANPPWKNQIINDFLVEISNYPIIYPGETALYYFIIPVPDGYWNTTLFKLTANVTILNHSGRLGQPFGPSPSTTTVNATTIYVNSEVHVEDTNGYEWIFNQTSQVSYTITINYDPSRGDYYVHENTATIIETNQSSTWTIDVYQQLYSMSNITGTVFWDNNYDGAYNGGDTTIEGSRIDLYVWNSILNDWTYISTTYTNEYGYYYFEVPTMYTYKVLIYTPPVCNQYIQARSTTPGYYEIIVGTVPSEYPDNDFGFVCLVQLTGAKSKGYWSWSLYNKRSGTWSTRITMGDVNYINQVLNTSFTYPLDVANYLISPVYGNMSTALMQQLIATLLNLRYGYISGDQVVYYNETYMSIDEIVNEAIDALSSQDRCTQEYYKTLLDLINNNYVLVVYPM